jgi:hypothetical protein
MPHLQIVQIPTNLFLKNEKGGKNLSAEIGKFYSAVFGKNSTAIYILERITFTTFLLLPSIYFFDNWDSRSYPLEIFNAN